MVRKATVVAQDHPSPLIGRFLAKIKVARSGCWLWTGAKSNGYGYFAFAGANVRAHAFAYELLRGQVGKGNHLHHTCENKLCVNPAHLQALSPKAHRRIHSAKQTHCINGHEFTPLNTRITKAGHRACRVCDYDRKQRARTT